VSCTKIISVWKSTEIQSLKNLTKIHPVPLEKQAEFCVWHVPIYRKVMNFYANFLSVLVKGIYECFLLIFL